MPSSYTNELRLNLQAQGENDTTWGLITNVNLMLLEDAISGMKEITTTGGTVTLTTANGGSDYNTSEDQARYAALKIVGSLTSNATIIVPNKTKIYLIWNATSGSYTLTVKTSSGSGVEVSQTKSNIVFCDGTNVYKAITDVGAAGDFFGTSSSVDGEIVLFDGTSGKQAKRATQTGLLKANNGVLTTAVAGTDYLTPGSAGDFFGTSSSVDGEIVLFNGTTGKYAKRATQTGLLKATSGVLSTAVAGVDYLTPGSAGDFYGTSSSVDGEIVLFNGTTGKQAKRATQTGLLKATSGVLSTAVAGTDYVVPELSINNQTGTSYTFVLSDAGKYVRFSNTGAISVTVPPNSSVAFNVGTQISIRQVSTGQVTVVAGTGVTINSPETLKLRKQGSSATLVKVDTNTWDLMGDLATS